MCLFREKLCEHRGDSYIPDIYVSYKQENGYDYLIVEDNGIGMNQHIIDNFYTNIGQSYYTSSEFFDLMAESNIAFSVSHTIQIRYWRTK